MKKTDLAVQKSWALQSFAALVIALGVVPGALPAKGWHDQITDRPNKSNATRSCFRSRLWDPEKQAFVRFSQRIKGDWDPDIRKCVRPRPAQ